MKRPNKAHIPNMQLTLLISRLKVDMHENILFLELIKFRLHLVKKEIKQFPLRPPNFYFFNLSSQLYKFISLCCGLLVSSKNNKHIYHSASNRFKKIQEILMKKDKRKFINPSHSWFTFQFQVTGEIYPPCAPRTPLTTHTIKKIKK